MRVLRALVGSTLLLPGLLLCLAPRPASGGASGAVQEPDVRPNVVLVTTDDQTLSDLAWMPITRRLFGNRGASLRGISPHPLCCPARAEMLTGQFAQNNGVYSNSGPHGGYAAFDPSSTVATWLHDAGYSTAFLGKFLNGYASTDDPAAAPGWDEWHPTVKGVYNYTDFTIDDNGVPTTYTDSYQTDVYTTRAQQILAEFASADQPFFLWQSYVSPHGSCPPSDELSCWAPPVPAERHAGLFGQELPPAFGDPSFDEADVTDKPAWVQARPRLTDDRVTRLIDSHQNRLRALQSVDEGVGRMVRTLRRTGELSNTVVIFTSDNGYLLGEHRVIGKNVPYEPALQVPFLIRGPGVAPGQVSDKVAAMVDIAPTIAAVAGVTPGIVTDGRDLLPVLDGEERGWATLLIQAGALPRHDEVQDWFFRGVRTARYTYVSYALTGEAELYDRRRDPAELTNVADRERYAIVREELQRRSTALQACAGETCRQEFGRMPKPRHVDRAGATSPR